MIRIFIAVAIVLCPALALAQGTLLQGGPWTPGHAPVYVPGGNSQAVVTDSGPARGGGAGAGLSELGITAQGTGTPPYAGQGTGPDGTTSCIYDAPVSSGNYHFLCFSANAQGGPLIIAGYGGIASPLPFQFIINGTSGATCSGSPSSSYATIGGVVTHC